MKHLALFAFPLAAIAMPATAATLVVNGTTVGGPTYNRPLAGTPPTVFSDVGTAVNYSVIGFSVGTAGPYSLTVASGFDSFLTLYSGAFDPLNPFANAIAADDDSAPTRDFDARIISNLMTTSSYFAVVSAFSNGVSGAFTLTIDGPGSITPAGVIPEPATWAMMLAGFAMMGSALRYRRRSVAIAFR